jgi:hypothetical protein
MSFSGDLYPEAGATSVMTTKGDIVRYDSQRERYGIGSANQILQVKSNLPSWETVPLADTVLTTAGDILYEDATPALARLASGTQYNTLQMGATLPAWSASATSVLTTTGDLLYASGANTLARLAGGTSGDVLTANGAGVAPSYQTPTGGGSWTEAADVTLGTPSQLSTGTITAYSQLDVWVFGANTSSQNTAITFNNDATANYKNNQWVDDVYASNAGNSELPIYGGNTTTASFIHLSIWNPSSGEVGYKWDGINFNGAGANLPLSLSGWGKYIGGQVTQIDKSQYGNVSINQATGARIVVFGAN